MKKLVASAAIVAVLVVVDNRVAATAHQALLETNANFQNRWENADLDVDGARKQACEIDTRYGLYAFQTCFILLKDQTGGNAHTFQYVYHRPQPLAKFYSRKADGLYFDNTFLGQSLETVRTNGEG